MKRLSPQEAAAQGYRSITSDIWPLRDDEKEIVKSVESTMRGCDAVWIETSYGSIQCARKTSELHLSERETDSIKKS